MYEYLRFLIGIIFILVLANNSIANTISNCSTCQKQKVSDGKSDINSEKKIFGSFLSNQEICKLAKNHSKLYSKVAKQKGLDCDEIFNSYKVLKSITDEEVCRLSKYEITFRKEAGYRNLDCKNKTKSKRIWTKFRKYFSRRSLLLYKDV